MIARQAQGNPRPSPRPSPNHFPLLLVLKSATVYTSQQISSDM